MDVTDLKEIKPRAMTFTEFEEYCDFLEENAKQEKEETGINKDAAMLKAKNRLSKWVMEHIYNIDVAKLKCSWMTITKFVDQTETLTMKSELDDEKNSETSGNGESEAAQDFAKLAEKPLNNGAEN